MKPNRLLLVAAAGITLLASVGATVGTADAASSTSYSKRVCAHAATGYAACDAHVRTNGNLRPLATTSYQSGFSPAQLKTAYGLTGLDGTTKVAIVDAYANPNAQKDLDAYRAQFLIPQQTIQQVNQNGGTALASADVGWGQEEMLDLEMVSAICNSCPILYVGANSASFNDLAAAVRTAHSLGAKVISNSYGGKEFSTETSLTSSYSFSDATVLASTGDSGYGAQAPAAFASVVAVGGTHLVLNGSTRTETVWSGAGSGCSAYIAKPTWQTATAGCAKRTIGDVAAVADPATGVAVYDSYGSSGNANWYVFGGTSVAAPLVGGVYGLQTTNHSSTSAQKLYTNRSSLYDVTSGSNGRCTKGRNTSTAYLCTGTIGYDGPTGNGTPNGLGAF